jgi:ADP-ribosylglycohydrolase
LERIQAILTGIGLGDALGLPVETKTHNEIATKYGPIKSFLPLEINDYYRDANCPPGTTSDDLQLTAVVMRALADSRRYDPQSMIVQHAVALADCPLGWGDTTKRGVKLALEHGAKWFENETPSEGGIGNGVPMKIAGLALLSAMTYMPKKKFFEILREFAMMTHPTSIGVASGAAHAAALLYCLSCTEGTFSKEEFSKVVCNAASESIEEFKPLNGMEIPGHRAEDLILALRWATERHFTTKQQIINQFGGGCRVVESLPFSYASFLFHPRDFTVIVETVSAGGDTDSNGAFVGGLLGALMGRHIFPRDLVAELKPPHLIERTADEFWNVFGR